MYEGDYMQGRKHYHGKLIWSDHPEYISEVSNKNIEGRSEYNSTGGSHLMILARIIRFLGKEYFLDLIEEHIKEI